VSLIRKRIIQNNTKVHKYKIILGNQISNRINPFISARISNFSTSQKIFKFRLLHGDIFCNERMFKFKMVNSPNCNRCGQIESIKHVVWDCARAKRVWQWFNELLSNLNYTNRVDLQSIFLGFYPTKPVLESIITKLTQTLLGIERTADIQVEIMSKTVLNFINLNIGGSIERNNFDKNFNEWELIRDYIKNNT